MARKGENHEPFGLHKSAGLYSRSRGEDEELEHCRMGSELLRGL